MGLFELHHVLYFYKTINNPAQHTLSLLVICSFFHPFSFISQAIVLCLLLLTSTFCLKQAFSSLSPSFSCSHAFLTVSLGAVASLCPSQIWKGHSLSLIQVSLGLVVLRDTACVTALPSMRDSREEPSRLICIYVHVCVFQLGSVRKEKESVSPRHPSKKKKKKSPQKKESISFWQNQSCA